MPLIREVPAWIGEHLQQTRDGLSWISYADLHGERMSEECAIQAVPELGDLARRFNIRMILQFGSTVTGTTHAHSDLDLAVQLDNPIISLQTVLEIQEALQAQFPGREVDLAILNLADPLFMKKIIESCRMLFGTPQTLAHLRLYSFKTYQDFRPYLELERQSVVRRLAALATGPSRP